MNSADELMIKSLQEEFFTDPDGILEQFFELVVKVRSDPLYAFKETYKLVHSIKGTSQAIGLTTFGSGVTLFEDSLNHLINILSTQNTISEQALIKLELVLSGVINNFELCFSNMKANGADCEVIPSEHLDSIAKLKAWSPEVDTSDWGMGLKDEQPAVIENKAEPIKEIQPEPIKVSVVESALPKIEDKPATNINAERIGNFEANQKMEAIKIIAKDQYLLLHKNNRTFAVPLHEVIEILEYRNWCALPVKRDGLLGVMNRFGESIPIIDFGYITGVTSTINETSEQNLHRSIIVCVAQNYRFGVPVDTVKQIVYLKKECLQPVSKVDFEENKGVITNMAILNKETIFMVDLASAIRQVLL